MKLNFDHLQRCSQTLDRSLQSLAKTEPGSIDYEVFRNAVIKSFELTLETAGKLLRKVLKQYVASPKTIDALVFKDVLRHAALHGLLSAEELSAGSSIATRATTPHIITEKNSPSRLSSSSPTSKWMRSRFTKRSDKNMADPLLSLQPRHLQELRRLIATYLPQEEVWAYGSRVAGTAHDTSDLDLVVRHPTDLKVQQSPAFWDLKEAMSESNLPFLVQLFDWARLAPAFWDNIARQHVVLYCPDLHTEFTESALMEEDAQVNENEQRYGK